MDGEGISRMSASSGGIMCDGVMGHAWHGFDLVRAVGRMWRVWPWIRYLGSGLRVALMCTREGVLGPSSGGLPMFMAMQWAGSCLHSTCCLYVHASV